MNLLIQDETQQREICSYGSVLWKLLGTQKGDNFVSSFQHIYTSDFLKPSLDYCNVDAVCWLYTIFNSCSCTNCGESSDATPMMRHAPNGTKSFCNACGLMWANSVSVHIFHSFPLYILKKEILEANVCLNVYITHGLLNFLPSPAEKNKKDQKPNFWGARRSIIRRIISFHRWHSSLIRVHSNRSLDDTEYRTTLIAAIEMGETERALFL